MARPKFDRRSDCERIVERAYALHLTAKDLCDAVGINPVTLSRGRSTGQIGKLSVDKLQAELARIEAERAAA